MADGPQIFQAAHLSNIPIEPLKITSEQTPYGTRYDFSIRVEPDTAPTVAYQLEMLAETLSRKIMLMAHEVRYKFNEERKPEEGWGEWRVDQASRHYAQHGNYFAYIEPSSHQYGRRLNIINLEPVSALSDWISVHPSLDSAKIAADEWLSRQLSKPFSVNATTEQTLQRCIFVLRKVTILVQEGDFTGARKALGWLPDNTPVLGDGVQRHIATLKTLLKTHPPDVDLIKMRVADTLDTLLKMNRLFTEG